MLLQKYELKITLFKNSVVLTVATPLLSILQSNTAAPSGTHIKKVDVVLNQTISEIIKLTLTHWQPKLCPITPLRLSRHQALLKEYRTMQINPPTNHPHIEADCDPDCGHL